MVDAVERILKRYGTGLIVKHAQQEESFRGFLQHSGSRSWQNMERVFGPLGEIPTGQYILLAPIFPKISEGDTIFQGNLAVTVRRVETVMIGDRQAYRWGLCVKKAVSSFE